MGVGYLQGGIPIPCEGEQGDHNRGLEGTQDLILQPETGACVQSLASESCLQL